MTDEIGTSRGRSLVPSARSALLAGLAIVAVAFGGLVGLVVVIVVVAAQVSGERATLLGGMGVTLLVAAPLVVLGNGLPAEGQISPGIVTDTLVPHHLVFAGLALVCTWVIIDVVPRRVHDPHPEVAEPVDDPGGPRWLRRALFAVVVVAAALAVVAVIQA